MSKQMNKVQKRKRLARYIKRKKENRKAAIKSKAAPAVQA